MRSTDAFGSELPDWLLKTRIPQNLVSSMRSMCTELGLSWSTRFIPVSLDAEFVYPPVFQSHSDKIGPVYKLNLDMAR